MRIFQWVPPACTLLRRASVRVQYRPENKFSVPEEFCPFVQEAGAKDE